MALQRCRNFLRIRTGWGRQGRRRGRLGAQSTKNPTAEGEVEELAEVGSRLEEPQAQADTSSSRARGLDLQNQRLKTCANMLTTFAFGDSLNG